MSPVLVKTAPRLPDGTPFPTLYYLTHPGADGAAQPVGVVWSDEMTERLQQDSGWPRPAGARTVVPAGADAIRSLGDVLAAACGPGQVPARADGAFVGRGP